MMNPGMRLIEENMIRAMLLRTDTQFRLLATQRTYPDTLQTIAKTTDFSKNVSTHAIAAPIRVAYGCQRPGQPTVTTAQHPVELFREPVRLFSHPAWLNRASHTQNLRIGTEAVQLQQPIGFRSRIIVEKGDKSPMSQRYSAVAR